MSGKRGLGSWIYKSQYGVFSHQNCRPILRRPSSRGGSLDSPPATRALSSLPTMTSLIHCKEWLPHAVLVLNANGVPSDPRRGSCSRGRSVRNARSVDSRGDWC